MAGIGDADMVYFQNGVQGGSQAYGPRYAHLPPDETARCGFQPMRQETHIYGHIESNQRGEGGGRKNSAARQGKTDLFQ
jgi:hypothetical protein